MSSSSSSAPRAPDLPKKRRLWPYVVGLIVVAAGAWYATHRAVPDDEGGAKSAEGRRGGPGGRGDKPTPVTPASIAASDIRVTVPALGSVVPRNQVTVRSRVDGPLLAVKFTEGQPVKAGEVLALIDPEPFTSIFPGAWVSSRPFRLWATRWMCMPVSRAIVQIASTNSFCAV